MNRRSCVSAVSRLAGCSAVPAACGWVLAACGLALAACGFPRPADVAECTAASDCKSPAAPFCIGGSCVAACQVNDDCRGLAGTPFCQVSTGACVACLDASACSADKPVCDATAGTCRGCARDEECASGACMAADGQCADEGSLLYVAGTSSADTGGCTKASPCATLSYALSQVTPPRNVIVVHGGQLLPTDTIAVNRSVYIDGNGVGISRGGTVFAISQFMSITLDNVRIADTSVALNAATVGASSSLRLYRADVTGTATTTGGTIAAINSTFSSGIACMDGTIAVQGSSFKNAPVNGMNCQVSVQGSRFDMPGGGSVTVQGGFAKIENNVVVNGYELADSMHVTAVAPGSVVRFNTFFNSSGVPGDGVALYCDGTPLVTSNIFAYGSMHPGNESPRCGARYSLYDSVALPEQTVGAGNQVGDSATFFVDKVGKDFHLSAMSPAKGGAEPGLDISRDIDGVPRPSPAGSQPDMGAYEAR